MWMLSWIVIWKFRAFNLDTRDSGYLVDLRHLIKQIICPFGQISYRSCCTSVQSEWSKTLTTRQLFTKGWISRDPDCHHVIAKPFLLSKFLFIFDIDIRIFIPLYRPGSLVCRVRQSSHASRRYLGHLRRSRWPSTGRKQHISRHPSTHLSILVPAGRPS